MFNLIIIGLVILFALVCVVGIIAMCRAGGKDDRARKAKTNHHIFDSAELNDWQ